MNVDRIRTHCLSFPDAEECLPFGPDVLVFKVKGKVFLILPLDTDRTQFNVKCDPETAIDLRERHTCVTPGYHMNKKHWNTIVVDGSLKDSDLRHWIEHSYKLVRK